MLDPIHLTKVLDLDKKAVAFDTKGMPTSISCTMLVIKGPIHVAI